MHGFDDWREGAACADGALTAVFFAKDGKRTGAAAKMCAGCGVATECLAFALADPTLHGVWAGTTHADRRRLRAEPTAA